MYAAFMKQTHKPPKNPLQTHPFAGFPSPPQVYSQLLDTQSITNLQSSATDQEAISLYCSFVSYENLVKDSSMRYVMSASKPLVRGRQRAAGQMQGQGHGSANTPQGHQGQAQLQTQGQSTGHDQNGGQDQSTSQPWQGHASVRRQRQGQGPGQGHGDIIQAQLEDSDSDDERELGRENGQGGLIRRAAAGGGIGMHASYVGVGAGDARSDGGVGDRIVADGGGDGERLRDTPSPLAFGSDPGLANHRGRLSPSNGAQPTGYPLGPSPGSFGPGSGMSALVTPPPANTMQGIHGMSSSVSPDALGSDDEGYDGGPSPISSAGLGAFPNLYDDEGQPITSTSVITAGRLFGLGVGDTAETIYAETHDADNFTLRGDLWAKKENPYMLFNQAGKDAGQQPRRC
mmetsp:Transcript_96415/g.274847  ORF Transcript_96415/g.274847 Transcript_96415/m.274847 type:complete len:401 (-) Transcript_96415:329-1531(-)